MWYGPFHIGIKPRYPLTSPTKTLVVNFSDIGFQPMSISVFLVLIYIMLYNTVKLKMILGAK